jgi:hypothetical protein
VEEERAMSGFAITDHKGVQFTFPNGITVSIQWGPGNYCGDYWDFKLSDYDAPRKSRLWESPDAEVALFWADRTGSWLTKEAYAALHGGEEPGDDVLPAVTPEEVVRYLAWAEAHPPRAPASATESTLASREST